MVAREWRTGCTIREWADRLASMSRPPFPVGADSLFVAYYASAELGCFRELGWPVPARILDLFCEFRNITNGLDTVAGNSLLGALAHFGLRAIDAAEKKEMRELAQREGPHSEAERAALLAYCESDVLSLAKLLPAMLPKIDLPRALLRGRYLAAVASMEWNGIPIDLPTLETLRASWDEIKGRLIEQIDEPYGVYVPVGQPLDRQTTFGAEVFRTAQAGEIDPYVLAVAAKDTWKETRAAEAELQDAIKAARKATGLTVNRIHRWENAGYDYANWPGLDVQARTLAGQYPALGIGRGFVDGANYDDTDSAGQLWALLRNPPQPTKLRHDPEVLDQAIRQIDPAYRVPRLSFNTREVRTMACR